MSFITIFGTLSSPIAGSAPARHPLHNGLVWSRRPPSSRTRHGQYDAAGALVRARRHNDVTRCNGIDMPSCGPLCANTMSSTKPEVHTRLGSWEVDKNTKTRAAVAGTINRRFTLLIYSTIRQASLSCARKLSALNRSTARNHTINRKAKRHKTKTQNCSRLMTMYSQKGGLDVSEYTIQGGPKNGATDSWP